MVKFARLHVFKVWFVKQALQYGRFWYPTDPACFEEMPDYLEELNSNPPRVLEPEGWLMGEGILEFQKNQLPENVPYIKGWYTCKSSGILYESAKRSSRVVLIAPRGSMLYVKYIIDLGGDYMGYTDFGWLMLANSCFLSFFKLEKIKSMFFELFESCKTLNSYSFIFLKLVKN